MMEEIGAVTVEAITPDGIVEYRTPLHICNTCGAAVANPTLHTAWHEPA